MIQITVLEKIWASSDALRKERETMYINKFESNILASTEKTSQFIFFNVLYIHLVICNYVISCSPKSILHFRGHWYLKSFFLKFKQGRLLPRFVRFFIFLKIYV